MPVQLGVEMRPVRVEVAVEQPRHERDHDCNRLAEARQFVAQAHQGLVSRVGVHRDVGRLDSADRLNLRRNGVRPVEVSTAVGFQASVAE